MTLRELEVAAVAPYCGGLTLEVGCGWRKALPTNIGCDPIPRGGTIPPYGHRSVAEICGRFEALPFRSQWFSCVLSMHVLEHIEALEDAMSEAARALIPEGVFACIVPNGENPAIIGKDATHVRDWGFDKWRRFFDLQRGRFLPVEQGRIPEGGDPPWSFCFVLRRTG